MILDRELVDDISSGSATPEEALERIQGALSSADGAEVMELVYEGLRGLVFQLVASREAGRHLDEWADLVLRVRQLARRRAPSISERFVVLADFLEQASRFRELHSVKQVRRRKHVVEMLELLAASGVPVDRGTLKDKTELGDANLSRVFANLSASGWISRLQNGREVSIAITEEGLSALREMTGRTYQKADQAVYPEPLATLAISGRWPEKLCSIAVSDGQKGLTWWQEGFKSLFPSVPSFDDIKADVSELRQHLATATDATDEVLPEEVNLADGRTFRVTEHAAGDGTSIWLSFDVTDYRQRLDLYARRERRLVAELEALKKWQAVARSARPADDDQSLETFATLRRDLLTPLNALYHSAHWLCKSNPPNLTREQWEVVNDMFNHTSKARGLIRTLVYMAEKPVARGVLDEAFNPIEVMHDVLGNLAMTSRSNGVAVVHGMHPTNSTRSVVGNEIAFRTVITKTLCDFIDGSPWGSKVGIDSKLAGGSFNVNISSAVKSAQATGALYEAMSYCDSLTSAMGANFAMYSDHQEIGAKISFPVKSAGKKLAVG